MARFLPLVITTVLVGTVLLPNEGGAHAAKPTQEPVVCNPLDPFCVTTATCKCASYCEDAPEVLSTSTFVSNNLFDPLHYRSCCLTTTVTGGSYIISHKHDFSPKRFLINPVRTVTKLSLTDYVLEQDVTACMAAKETCDAFYSMVGEVVVVPSPTTTTSAPGGAGSGGYGGSTGGLDKREFKQQAKKSSDAVPAPPAPQVSSRGAPQYITLTTGGPNGVSVNVTLRGHSPHGTTDGLPPPSTSSTPVCDQYAEACLAPLTTCISNALTASLNRGFDASMELAPGAPSLPDDRLRCPWKRDWARLLASLPARTNNGMPALGQTQAAVKAIQDTVIQNCTSYMSETTQPVTGTGANVVDGLCATYQVTTTSPAYATCYGLGLNFSTYAVSRSTLVGGGANGIGIGVYHNNAPVSP